MFLIAGVTPKIKVLDDTPKKCPVCGLGGGPKNLDNVLSSESA